MKHEVIDHPLKEPYVRICKSRRTSEASTADWHFHEDTEIIRILEGNKDIYLNNALYTIEKGDVIIINEYTPHKTYSPIGNESFLLQFNVREFTACAELPETGPAFFIFKNGTELCTALTETLLGIEKEYEAQEKAFERFIQAHIYKIIAVFYRNGIFTDASSTFASDKKEKLFPVFEYVRNHYAENIRLDEIASMISLNKSYFCRLFKSCTGMPFTEYLCKIRLNAAEKLLLDGKKTITEAAYEVGFSSPAYFSKIFRDFKDYPPSFYKKLQRR